MSIGALTVSAAAAARLSAAPANDRFSSAARLVGAEGTVSGNNLEATDESREPTHAGTGGGQSVWWRWSATADGGAVFDTFGSSFDTVLAVYTGDSVDDLTLVSSSDDQGAFTQSMASFEVVAGTEYRIAVDGYGGESGLIHLSWRSVPRPVCEPPSLPAAREPADGAAGVAPSVTLRWGEAPAVRQKIIYGRDDRQEVYQVADPELRAAWDSTVALFSRGDLVAEPNGSYSVRSPATFAEEYEVCSGEPYRDQPVPAWCSGFLVAPDLVATAGHCLPTGEDCADVAFVFGYRMLDAETPVLSFDASQVYSCQEIIATHDGADLADWALVRLDRPVPDHAPLPIRRSGKIADRSSVLVIGHPVGLPAKIAGGARVRDNQPSRYFVANLDTYGGNSGSAVLDAATLRVEGILVRGEPEEFVQRGDCWVSRVCADDDCQGEDVTRTTVFDALVPQKSGEVTYQVFFGRCPSPPFVAETTEPAWTAENLEPGRRYCWQVAAKSDCGVALGPVWSFTVGGGDASSFRRGDVAADGSVDLSDAIKTLNWLFLSGPAPLCLDAADADDNGAVNLTDAIYLLNWLFLSGPAVPAPLGECGVDPTGDALDCVEAPGC